MLRCRLKILTYLNIESECVQEPNIFSRQKKNKNDVLKRMEEENKKGHSPILSNHKSHYHDCADVLQFYCNYDAIMRNHTSFLSRMHGALLPTSANCQKFKYTINEINLHLIKFLFNMTFGNVAARDSMTSHHEYSDYTNTLPALGFSSQSPFVV